MADSVEFGKRVANMVLFLEQLANSSHSIFVPDPIELGEDFLKMGTYLLKPYLAEEQFLKVMKDLWDDVPEEEEESDEEVLFEAD